MKEMKRKEFANGIVYLYHTDDGFPVEITDTFLPYATKDAINRKTNVLETSSLGSRAERWMIGVSVSSGCIVGCKFCGTGQLKKFRNLTADEIVDQVMHIVIKNRIDPRDSKEFKINYTRMGDVSLNLKAVQKAIEIISQMYPNTHHYVSTIGVRGVDYSWISGNVTLQVSLHSLREDTRNELIPFKGKMTIEELGKIRTNSNLKTTVNLTLVDENDFDINVLKRYFDPKYFFIKISPLNRNCVSDANSLRGVIQAKNLI
jgi:hypothetical protein